jgi:hypothetical protein
VIVGGAGRHAGGDADLLRAKRDVPGQPGARAEIVATRTGPRPETSTVTVPLALLATGPERRLQWPMKSATNRVFGKP